MPTRTLEYGIPGILHGLRIVRAGAVRAGNVGADGESLTLGVFGPGQTFGEMTLFADLPRTFDVYASGPTTIGHIDKDRMEELLRDHPELTRVFLRTLAMQLHAALELVEDLRRLPVTVHVAKLLSTMAKTDRHMTTLEVTHESLSQTLGVTRASVARALDRLEQEGLLRRGYGRIELPDVPSLRAWVAKNSRLSPVG